MIQVGTPYYVSPEVVKGAGYDWKSDVWSLGCLLYELALLRSPFEMEGASLMAVFKKISEADYEALQVLPPTLTRADAAVEPQPCACASACRKPNLKSSNEDGNRRSEGVQSAHPPPSAPFRIPGVALSAVHGPSPGHLVVSRPKTPLISINHRHERDNAREAVAMYSMWQGLGDNPPNPHPADALDDG